MAALSEYRALLHSCGHTLDESASPDAEGRYVVDPPTRCHACTALEIKQADYTEVKHPAALMWRVRRR